MQSFGLTLRLHPFDTAGRVGVDVAESVEQHPHDGRRQQEPVVDDRNQADDGGELYEELMRRLKYDRQNSSKNSPYQNAIHHGRRQKDVDAANVARKAVQNPARRVRVEEEHRGPGDAPEQLVVQPDRCPQAEVEEGEGSVERQAQHDGHCSGVGDQVLFAG